jgi:hypothetical protein
MQKMPGSISCFIAALFILANPRPLLACTCRGVQQPPCAAFREATAVFSGPVLDFKEAPHQSGDRFHYLMVEFAVEKSYKGVSESELSIATLTGTSCDFGFQKGERYFVYAHRDSRQNRLVTGFCSRTKPLSSANEDIEHAEGLTGSLRRSSIMGADSEFSSPLEGSEIIVEGDGKKYTAVADRKGGFRIELERGGKYRIRLIGPKGYLFFEHYDSWKVSQENGRPVVQFVREVPVGECDFIDLSQHLTVKKGEK